MQHPGPLVGVEGGIVVVADPAHGAEIISDHKGDSGAQSVEHGLATGGDGASVDSIGLDRGLLNAGRKELIGSVAYIAVIPVVRAVLVIIHELEAVHIVHELNGHIVAEEDNVVASGGVGTEISLSSLRDARIANERRPNEAMHSLIPKNCAEGGVIEAREQADDSLIVVLADLLGNEASLVLVVNSKASIHINLIYESRGLQERELCCLLCVKGA
mmetsp:Transcript_46466/g.123324  ORF Transcript_46466/g.123324 Transcript_46466/m.123324 type:complete len:216 (-) Transcript_46466:112-759(-)